MPWQRDVADVALELDPGTGLLAYREVTITVPRQSGKTTLQLAVMVHRALGFGGPQRIVYTAQDRLSARKKWEDDHVLALERSPLRGMFTVRKQIGQEAVRWRNGSLHGLTAPSEKAVHGETLDLGVIDEAFAREDDRVEQGMKPAMVTRPQAQLWVVSTAGTHKSTYLRGKVDAGRLAADAGIRSGVAYFEWSARPDQDPADPRTWYGCMPALGRTARPEAIRADYQTMQLDEFRRAYLNLWPSDAPDEWLVVGRDAWAVLADPTSQIAGRPALAVDVNPDRTWACIGAAGRRPDGMLHVEVLAGDHRPGTAWVVPRLRQLVADHDPCAVVIAPSGPANSLIPDAEAAGIEVLKVSVGEVAGGCGAFYDHATDAKDLRHLDQPELNTALAGALKRELGERWLWDRKGVSVDLTPLVAVTNALLGHSLRGHLADETPPQPFVLFGR